MFRPKVADEPLVLESKELEPLNYKPSHCFKGLVFYILGAVAGYTSAKMGRLIKDGGGKVTKDYTDDTLSCLIIAPALWSVEGTNASSMIIKNVRLANTANALASPDDPDAYRVWFLDLEWVIASLEAAEALDEDDFDLERCADKVKADRRRAAAKQAAKEKKANGGVSLYGPGERAKMLKAQRIQRDIKAAKEDAEREAKAREEMVKVEIARRAEQDRQMQVYQEQMRVMREQRQREDAERATQAHQAREDARRAGTLGFMPEMPAMPDFLDMKVYAYVPPPAPAPAPAPRYSSVAVKNAVVNQMIPIASSASIPLGGHPVQQTSAQIQQAAREREATAVKAYQKKKALQAAEARARQERMAVVLAASSSIASAAPVPRRENPADPGSAAYHKKVSMEKKEAARKRAAAVLVKRYDGGAGGGSSSSSASGSGGAFGGARNGFLSRANDGPIILSDSDDDIPLRQSTSKSSSTKRKSDDDQAGGRKKVPVVSLSSDEEDVPLARMQ